MAVRSASRWGGVRREVQEVGGARHETWVGRTRHEVQRREAQEHAGLSRSAKRTLGREVGDNMLSMVLTQIKR